MVKLEGIFRKTLSRNREGKQCMCLHALGSHRKRLFPFALPSAIAPSISYCCQKWFALHAFRNYLKACSQFIKFITISIHRAPSILFAQTTKCVCEQQQGKECPFNSFLHWCTKLKPLFVSLTDLALLINNLVKTLWALRYHISMSYAVLYTPTHCWACVKLAQALRPGALEANQ